MEQIYVNRLHLLKAIKTDLRKQVEERGEIYFRESLKAGIISFELVAAGDPDLNWELAQSFEVLVSDADRILQKRNGENLDRLLFEKVYERDFNPLEKDLAWYVDGEEAVRWWHRLVARHDYHLQGWQRNRIYPDFLVCLETPDEGKMRFSVLETKGDHLMGNDDSEYKRKLFELLTSHAQSAVKAGEFKLGIEGASIRFKMLLAETWRTEIPGALS